MKIPLLVRASLFSNLRLVEEFSPNSKIRILKIHRILRASKTLALAKFLRFFKNLTFAKINLLIFREIVKFDLVKEIIFHILYQ